MLLYLCLWKVGSKYWEKIDSTRRNIFVHGRNKQCPPVKVSAMKLSVKIVSGWALLKAEFALVTWKLRVIIKCFLCTIFLCILAQESNDQLMKIYVWVSNVDCFEFRWKLEQTVVSKKAQKNVILSRKIQKESHSPLLVFNNTKFSPTFFQKIT